MRGRLPSAALALVLLAAPAARGAAPPPPDAAVALAGRVSRHLERAWAARGVTPARPADDAEFARRLYLDLTGRIPSVSEARAFLADRRPDKRRLLAERLLAGPRYEAHWVNVWRARLVPETGSNLAVRYGVPGFEVWLRGQLAANAPYDRMVRDLLTVPLDGGRNPFGGGASTPTLFFQARDYKPEELASATARLFLGVNVGCAQCHNHPSADWKREHFWGFAAFYAGIRSGTQGDFVTFQGEDGSRRSLKIPGSEKEVGTRFLDGTAPAWGALPDPTKTTMLRLWGGVTGRELVKPADARTTRVALADWVTGPNNPYFTRAAVNTVWAHLLGTGLVEPTDEMAGADRLPSHPELLDELAGEFKGHGYDLKFLIKAVVLSAPYGLSGARTDSSGDDPRQFARVPPRGMSPEQLFDSVARATGYQEAEISNPYQAFGGPATLRSQFLARFIATERPVDVQTSILQALALMNGKLVAAATTLSSSGTLAAVADAPFLDTDAKVEALYLATLSRKPTPKERSRLVRYVEEGGPASAGDPAKRRADALADVFWALLNSGEFILNH